MITAIYARKSTEQNGADEAPGVSNARTPTEGGPR